MKNRFEKKRAQTTYPIHDVIARRWSGRAFSDQQIDQQILGSLFDAARWAPSSFNEQPWYFFIATKEQEAEYEQLLNLLSERNQRWAVLAPVLGLSVASTFFDKNRKENRHAWHDVGLAVENLVLQATFHGLLVHQMAGFDVEGARKTLTIPDGYDPVAMIAIGYPGEIEGLPETFVQSEQAVRSRKPMDEFVFLGEWGTPATDDIFTESSTMEVETDQE